MEKVIVPREPATEMLDAASGKRAPLSADECRELAYRLGVPKDVLEAKE